MYTRQWLETELAKNRPWDKHCWDSVLSRYSCVGYITTARELFKESKDRKDLDLWTKATKRAEEYVNAKDPHRPYGLFGIQDKTKEHKKYICDQRVLILFLTIEDNQAQYERGPDKAKLREWKASLTQAKKFLKENQRDGAALALQSNLDAYQLAEKEHKKNNSCFPRNFFWCCKKDDVLADNAATVDNHQSQHHYAKLNG